MKTLSRFVAVLLVTIILLPKTTDSIRIYSSTAEVSTNDHVPRGSTVVLVCTETPTPQQVDYQWTCPNPPCDGQYWKVYGNVLVVVATTATRGQYRCSPTPGSAATRILSVQGALVGDQLNIYNNERRLLPNTLFTNIQQIPNRLACPRRSGGVVPRFRRESDSTTRGTSSSQPTTVLASALQPNGGYRCDDGLHRREFFVYYTNAILPTPQVSDGSTATDQQLRLLLTTPPTYNSGRFILRYECTLGEADIEVEYRSVDPGVNSDTVVTRSRSCFVVGEISRVTVWFVNGENISTTPAVVNMICTSCDSTPRSTPDSISPTPSTTANTGPAMTATVSPNPNGGQQKRGPSSDIAIAVAVVVVFLLTLAVILTVVIVVLAVKCRRRSDDAKKQGLAYTYVKHEAEAQGKKDLMYDEVIGGGTRHDQDHDSIGENQLQLYAEVESPNKRNKPTETKNSGKNQHQNEFNTSGAEYADIDAPQTTTQKVAIYTDTVPVGYEDLDAITTNTKPTHQANPVPAQPPAVDNTGAGGDLYTVPDMSKKKNKRTNKSKEPAPSTETVPLTTTEEPTRVNDGDLYTVPDMSKKKNRIAKSRDDANQTTLKLTETPYEPTADNENKVEQSTLYAEVDNSVKD